MAKRKIGRQPKNQDQYPRFLIISEGAVTERQYLEAVKRSRKIRSARLEFVPPGPTSPVEIVRLAYERRKQAQRDDPFDHVWCIFDVEAKVNQQCRPGFPEALDLAARWDISLAISNPCIELWILLHREDHQAWIDSHICQNKCAKLKLTDGKHLVAPDDLYQEYSRAREYADNLEQKHIRDGTKNLADHNPSSSVYKLVDAICALFPQKM
jgi:RloB-like protein